MKTPSLLIEIAELTKRRVEKREMALSFIDLKKRVEFLDQTLLPFETLFVQGPSPCIIAEIKKKSPSQGSFNSKISPAQLAQDYQKAGAVAVSILTEPTHFLGEIEDVLAVRSRCPNLPLLQKDFMLGPYQIFEAKLIGASCVLLIVALLEEKKLQDLYRLASSLKQSVLVEVHSEHELKVALDLGANIIGINNRDLHTLKISLDTSRRLSHLIPEHVIAISESGISTADEIKELRALGYDGFLIGSSFMQEPSPGQALQELIENCQ